MGKSLILIGNDTSVQVWDIYSKEEIFNQTPVSSFEKFSAVRYESPMLVIQSFYSMHVYAKNGKKLDLVRKKIFNEYEDFYISHLKVHFSGYTFIGSHEGVICIIDDYNSSVVQNVTTSGEVEIIKEKETDPSAIFQTKFDKKINCICFNEDGSNVYVGHENNMLSIWSFNMLQSKKLKLLKTINTSGPVTHLEHKKKLIAIVNANGNFCAIEI